MNCKTAALSIIVLLLACQPAPADEYCPADVSGDLQADTNDLLAVINDWGPCPVGSPCYTDTNSDAVVDVSDLLVVINGWGSCNPVFDLDEFSEEGVNGPSGKQTDADDRGATTSDALNTDYCTYQITASAPGSAMGPGTILCTSCPLTWMNACPPLANATFKGVPGAPGALSTGVNATPVGNGFCQTCPPAAGGRRYHRSG
jgi:hypothetical protein